MYNALYVDTFTVVDCKLCVLPSIDVVKFPDLHFTIDYIPQKYLWIVWYDKAIPRVYRYYVAIHPWGYLFLDERLDKVNNQLKQ